MIALREQSLEKIGPMNEKIIELMNSSAFRAHSPSTANPMPLQTNQSGNGTFHGSSSANSVSSLTNSEVTRRTSKRKLANENSLNAKRRGDVPKLERPIPKSFPAEYPFNKEGYRFVEVRKRMSSRDRSYLGIIWPNQIRILHSDKNLTKQKSGLVSRHSFLDWIVIHLP